MSDKRVVPSAAVAVGVFLAYLTIVVTAWLVMGVEYDELADSADTVRDGVIIPIGLGATFLAITATVFGWWRPLLREERRAGSRWMLSLPGLLVVATIITMTAVDWGELDAEFLILLAIGTALVGFSEEMLCRGFLVVGGRGSMPEQKVWVFSAVLFGLLHAPNALLGQAVGATASQIVFATVLGVVYYVIRRVTGSLLILMVLHAAWDFSVLSIDSSGADSSPVGGVLLLVAAVVAFVALRRLLAEPAPAEVPVAA
jgi:hypothetical protein